MIPIQPLLIIGLLALTVFYFSRVRTALLDRFVVFIFFGACVACVAWPALTTALARRLGVGRGTDLLLYVSVLGFGFVSLLGVSMIRQLRHQITRLARELAIATAENAIVQNRRKADGKA